MLAAQHTDTKLWRDAQNNRQNEEARSAILEAGGTIRQLTPEQRTAWVDAMKPVWTQFEGDVPAELVDAAQAINAGL